MPIRGIARSEWASRSTVWRKAAPSRPPEPASAASAERFERAIRIEHLEADTGPRVDVVERLAVRALFEIESHLYPPLKESLHDSVCARSGSDCARPGRVVQTLPFVGRPQAARSAGSARAKPRR